jgi:hypothetical protein
MKPAIFDDSVTIPANGRLPLSHSGDYLNIKDADGEFTIIYDTNSRFGGKINTKVKNVPYNSFEFVNDTASDIDVSFFYGMGGEAEINNVEIGSTVTVEIDEATYTSGKLIVYDTVNLDNKQILNGGDDRLRRGATVIGGTAIGANNTTSATLISPASNTGGYKIRQLVLSGKNGKIYAATSAPSSWTDTSKPCIMATGNDGNGYTLEAVDLPAGVGLYYEAFAASTSNGAAGAIDAM